MFAITTAMQQDAQIRPHRKGRDRAVPNPRRATGEMNSARLNKVEGGFEQWLRCSQIPRVAQHNHSWYQLAVAATALDADDGLCTRLIHDDAVSSHRMITSCG